MKMKSFLLGVAVLFMMNINAQDSLPDFIKSLSKKNIQFELRKLSEPSYITGSDSGYVIVPYSVYILGLDINRIIKKYDKKELLKALYNALSEDDKDWNANLLLYALTRRDAGLLMGVYDRKEWIKITKRMDIKLWAEYLGYTADTE